MEKRIRHELETCVGSRVWGLTSTLSVHGCQTHLEGTIFGIRTSVFAVYLRDGRRVAFSGR